MKTKDKHYYELKKRQRNLYELDDTIMSNHKLVRAYGKCLLCMAQLDNIYKKLGNDDPSKNQEKSITGLEKCIRRNFDVLLHYLSSDMMHFLCSTENFDYMEDLFNVETELSDYEDNDIINQFYIDGVRVIEDDDKELVSPMETMRLGKLVLAKTTTNEWLVIGEVVAEENI